MTRLIANELVTDAAALGDSSVSIRKDAAALREDVVPSRTLMELSPHAILDEDGVGIGLRHQGDRHRCIDWWGRCNYDATQAVRSGPLARERIVG
jgi:hypothetical protein